MRESLRVALRSGAIGFSTGLAYTNARQAPQSEIESLVEVLGEEGGVYTTHMRNERDQLFLSMEESFSTARHGNVPLVISHLKCAEKESWGKSSEALNKLEDASANQPCNCDCYPYSACSTTLDLWRVSDQYDIMITWSKTYPDLARKFLKDIAEEWGLDLIDAAKKLMPAGAIYHNMSEDDVKNILSHPLVMVGSDGLPSDPNPHPRLWGSFPRVLGHYCRDEGLFSLSEAIRKMTSMSAETFGIVDRGVIEVGAYADLTVFDFEKIIDNADYKSPTVPSSGLEKVFVNGKLAYSGGMVQSKPGCLIRETNFKRP
jgi:N-acyl-D-amino-acid deacylase